MRSEQEKGLYTCVNWITISQTGLIIDRSGVPGVQRMVTRHGVVSCRRT